jgi:hypothetical protein
MFIRSDIPKLKQDLTIQTHLLGHDLTLKTRWGVGNHLIKIFGLIHT